MASFSPKEETISLLNKSLYAADNSISSLAGALNGINRSDSLNKGNSVPLCRAGQALESAIKAVKEAEEVIRKEYESAGLDFPKEKE